MRRSGRRASMALALLMCLVLTSGLTVATIASGEPRGEPAVATILEWIETRIDPEGVTVILRGNGQLVAGAIREAEDLPPRLVFDLPNVESGVPSVTYVELGPLEKIRVAAYSREPLVTRVVFDLRRQGMYRVEPDVDEGGLTVVFRDQEAWCSSPRSWIAPI